MHRFFVIVEGLDYSFYINNYRHVHCNYPIFIHIVTTLSPFIVIVVCTQDIICTISRTCRNLSCLHVLTRSKVKVIMKIQSLHTPCNHGKVSLP